MVGLPGMGGGGGGTNAITSQAKSRSLLSGLSDPFGNRLRKKQFNDPQNYILLIKNIRTEKVMKKVER